LPCKQPLYNNKVKRAAILVVLISAALTVQAQTLRVYSEFAQVDSKGKVTAPAEPREILSPALARNAFGSFQVVVDAPAGTAWQLYIAQNPENAARAALYRENGSSLQSVTDPVSGGGTQIFWLDVWIDRDAPVRRIKVEPQLNINNDWVIYPMEGRVVDAIVPDAIPNGKWPEDTASPSEVIRGFVCASNPPSAAQSKAIATASVETLRFRNAQQDRALAAKAAKAELEQKFGACDAQIPADDPEWYFRIRDYLLRLP
jgi:hypothetical protein